MEKLGLIASGVDVKLGELKAVISISFNFIK